VSLLTDFTKLLQRGSAELYADSPDLVSTGELTPTANTIDAGDVALFFAGPGPVRWIVLMYQSVTKEAVAAKADKVARHRLVRPEDS